MKKLPTSHHFYAKGLRRLRSITGNTQAIPLTSEFNESIDVQDKPVFTSSAVDIRPGTYDGTAIAVKTIRITTKHPEEGLRVRRVKVPTSASNSHRCRNCARKLRCGAFCGTRISSLSWVSDRLGLTRSISSACGWGTGR
jgi:hypothetical protein